MGGGHTKQLEKAKETNVDRPSGDDSDDAGEGPSEEQKSTRLLQPGWKFVNDKQARTIWIVLRSTERIQLDQIEQICEEEIGQVESAAYTTNENEIMIVFENEKALGVVRKNKQRLQNEYSLTFRMSDQTDRPTAHAPHSSSESDDDEEDVHPDAESSTKPVKWKTSMEVRNVTKTAGKLDLKRFLQERLQGHIHINKVKDAFLIHFQKIKDAERLYKLHLDNPLLFSGKRLELRAIDDRILTSYPLSKSTQAIRLSGFSGDMTQDQIRKWFHGEKIESITIRNDVKEAVVTYRSVEDTEEILADKERLEKKHSISIRMLENNYRPNKLFEEHHTDRFVVQNLPTHANHQSIKDYIQHGTGLKVRKVMFGAILKKAIVYIRDRNHDFTYEKLYVLSRKKPIHVNMVIFEVIPKPCTIQITLKRDGEISTRDVTQYLKDATDKHPVVTQEEHGFKAVFDCHADMEDVLLEDHHTIQVCEVDISLLYTCLGFIPQKRDVARPNIRKQADIQEDVSFPSVLCFIQMQPKYKRQIEEAMEQVSTAVQFPEDWITSSVTLHCLLEGREENYADKIRTWEETARGNLQLALDRFVEKKLTLEKEVKTLFMTKWAAIANECGEEWMWDTQEDGTLVITGLKRIVKRNIETAQQLKQQILDELRRGDHFSSATVCVKPSLLLLDEYNTALNYEASLVPAIKMELRADAVKLDGPQQLVDELIVVLDALASRFVEKEHIISFAKSELLNKSHTVNLIGKSFANLQICVGIHAEENKLLLHAKSEKEILAALKAIDGIIKEDYLSTNRDRAYILKTTTWKQFLNQKKEQNNHQFEVSASFDERGDAVITLAKLLQLKKDVASDIQDFLNKFGIANTRVEMSFGAMLVIQEFHDKELNNWRAKMAVAGSGEDPSIDVDIDLPGFVLTGAKDLIPIVEKEIKKFAGKVKTVTNIVEEPGMSKYFMRNWSELANYGCRHKVSVTLGKGHGKETTGTTRQRKRRFDTEDTEEQLKLKVTCDDGIIIKVMTGDITKMRVDSIVNAANDRLQHTGGVAGAISKAGGPSIQDECLNYIKQHGNLQKGQIFVSGAGKLPCKQVIHTVGPVYRRGMEEEMSQQLMDAVVCALEAAETRKCRDVCLPAISAGIYGFPKESCSYQIALAINMFIGQANNSSIEEIIFIDINQEFVFLMCEQLKMMFPVEQITTPFDVPAETERHREGGSYDGEPTPRPFARPKSAAGRPRTASGRPMTARGRRDLGGGAAIQLHVTDITQEQVDVIVNTTSTSLKLTNGAVSNHILQCAGNTIQTECDAQYPNGIKCGEIAQTSAGNLRCKKIYHSALQSYSRGSPAAMQVFTRTITTCLELASAAGYKDIVFPALGSGNLGFPAHVVAKTFCDTCAEFMRRNPIASLKTIIIAVRAVDTNIIQAFQNEGVGPDAPTGHGLTTTRSDTVLPAASKCVWSTSEGIRVSVETGDIVTYAVDGILNVCGRSMKLNTGGLSSHILNKAGSGIQDECTQKAPNGVKYGEFVKTSGANLPCKFIYHCACDGYRSTDGVTTMKAAISACLHDAHRAGHTCLALPALGAGGLGFPANESAKIVKDVITNVSQMYPRTQLRAITISLWPSDTTIIQGYMQIFSTMGSVTVDRGPQPTVSRDDDDDDEDDMAADLPSASGAHPGMSFVKELTFAEEEVKQSAFGRLKVQVLVGNVSEQDTAAVNFRGDGGKVARRGKCITVDTSIRSKRDIEEAFMYILQRAESEEISALAVPLNPIEKGGSDPDAISRAIAQSIHTFAEKQYFNHLKVLRLLAEDASSRDTYHKALKDKSRILTIYLHSFEGAGFNKVENHILDATLDHCREVTLTKHFEEILGTLTDSHLKAIHDLENAHPVKIEIKNSPPLLKIKGLDEDIAKIERKLQEFQRMWFDRARRHMEENKAKHDKRYFVRMNKAYAQRVRWSVLEADAWKKYKKSANRVIEMAHENSEGRVYVPEDQTEIYIDLNTKFEINTKTHQQREVMRRELMDVPETWNDDYKHGEARVVDVDPSSGEFHGVKQTFIQDVGRTVTVLNIFRLQSLFLWNRYTNMKREMDNKGLSNPVEQSLWHGTYKDSTDMINTHGFDKAYFGKHGTAYGLGVYFAISANYSHNYAKPDAQGERYIYYAKVLTGDFTKGSSNIKVAPVKSGNVLYDSVVDRMDPAQRRMYVIFHQDQSYPEYLIKYKEG